MKKQISKIFGFRSENLKCFLALTFDSDWVSQKISYLIWNLPDSLFRPQFFKKLCWKINCFLWKVLMFQSESNQILIRNELCLPRGLFLGKENGTRGLTDPWLATVQKTLVIIPFLTFFAFFPLPTVTFHPFFISFCKYKKREKLPKNHFLELTA